MAKIDQEIVIKATDIASPIIRRVVDNARGAQSFLRGLGEASDVAFLKKIGKTADAVSDEKSISANKIRLEAAQAYRVEMGRVEQIAKSIGDFEAKAGKSEAARVASVLFRRDAEKEILELRTAAEMKFKGENQRASEVDGGGGIRGTLGKIGGAVAIAEVAGRTIQQVAGKLDDVNQKAKELNATGAEYAGEIGRAIPGIGSVAKGFDKIWDTTRNTAATIVQIAGGSKEWVEWIESGEAALGRANKEAAEIDARISKTRQQIAEVQDIRARVDKTITRELTPGQQIRKDRDDALSQLQADKQAVIARSRGGQLALEDQERFAKAEQAIKQKAIDASAKLQIENDTKERERKQAFWDAILKDEQEAQDMQRENSVKSLEAQGKTVEAGLAEIRNRYAKSREAIARSRDELGRESGLSTNERIARERALDKKDEALNAGQKLDEAAYTKSNADRIAEIRSKIEEQQSRLEKINAVSAVTVQGRQTAAAVDGRFQTSAAAQRALVETFKGNAQEVAAKETAKNTADTKKAIEALTKELQGLLGPVV